MICLFLDTSSDDLFVSIKKDNDIIYTKIIGTKNDHSSYLIKTIREGLSKNNLNIRDVNKIMCTVGPGSFTGTRIGITVAKTIAWSLNIPVIPVSSLKQYVFEYSNYDYYVPVINERKDYIYYSIYDKDYNEVGNEKYSSKDEMINRIKELNGNILIISNDDFDDFEVKDKVINSSRLIDYYKNEEGINPHSLKPNYIKRIEAESKL